MLRIFLLINLFFVTGMFAQTTQPQGSEKKGWAEGNRKNKSGFYAGFHAIYYHYGLTPLNIYASDVREEYTVSDNFKNRDVAPGFSLGGFTEKKGLSLRVEYCRNTVRTSAAYSDSTNQIINDKIKIANSQLSLILYRKFKKAPNLSAGASIDLGVFRTKQKRTGAAYTGKWEAFYYTNPLTGSRVKTSTLTVGAGLFIAYRIKNVTLSINRQTMIMDADMNGRNGRACYFNTHNYRIALYYAL